jgi:uncharacterized damage-inducible protein DinB
MDIAGLFEDSFGRIHESVHDVVDDASDAELLFRPDAEANSIAWLVWHLTRVQDDHVAAAATTEQVWISEGFVERFDLPFDRLAHGYGQSSREVGEVRVGAAHLAAYHDAVYARTVAFVGSLTDGDLDRIVDERFDPPVSLGVRLVSVISDDLQHVGQAAYVLGLARRR